MERGEMEREGGREKEEVGVRKEEERLKCNNRQTNKRSKRKEKRSLQRGNGIWDANIRSLHVKRHHCLHPQCSVTSVPLT